MRLTLRGDAPFWAHWHFFYTAARMQYCRPSTLAPQAVPSSAAAEELIGEHARSWLREAASELAGAGPSSHMKL